MRLWTGETMGDLLYMLFMIWAALVFVGVVIGFLAFLFSMLRELWDLMR